MRASSFRCPVPHKQIQLVAVSVRQMIHHHGGGDDYFTEVFHVCSEGREHSILQGSGYASATSGFYKQSFQNVQLEYICIYRKKGYILYNRNKTYVSYKHYHDIKRTAIVIASPFPIFRMWMIRPGWYSVSIF